MLGFFLLGGGFSPSTPNLQPPMNAYAGHGGGHSILNIYDICVCACLVIIIVLERQDLASVGPCMLYTHHIPRYNTRGQGNVFR